MRSSRSLAGSWQFQLDPDGSLTVATLAPDREIPVPLPWQAAFPDLRRYSGFAWYRREVDLPAEWLAGEVLLRFGAVDYWCQVFVNGRLAGEHEGGYTPITLPIRAFARVGANEIAVRVYDSVQTGLVAERWPAYAAEQPPAGPPFDAREAPHGKQEWYVNVGGIWQDVTLMAVPSAYLAGIHVTPDIHSGAAHVRFDLEGATGDLGAEARLEICDPGGAVVATGATPLAAGRASYEATLTVSDPRLWDVGAPNLYTVTVHLDGGDTLSARFGFREIRTEGGQLLLNGAPLFLLAALDQDLYPETIYTVPSEEYLRDQFRKAQALGLNCLRCHIKPPDPRYLDLADEMGLLVWSEIPSWRTFYPKGLVHAHELALHDPVKLRVTSLLREMVARDYNHPSIIIWTIVNEDWGTALPLSEADRAWAAQMYRLAKALDPTRLVVDNSACVHSWGPNVHVLSDLDDFHLYANIPDRAASFEQNMDQFGLRPLWSYSSHGDAQRSGQEPLILSEFGNWGLPSLRALRGGAGRDPDWFDLGPWWSPWDGEPGWPAGADARFERYGLGAIWRDYEAFAEATQWHQFAAMKFEIEAMRRQPRLAGYVITELTDAYWESNGLLDFDRRPKAYHDRFHEINAPDMIVARPARYSAWDDTPLPVALTAAHYSAQDWSGAHLQWRVGGEGGTIALPDIARGAVEALGVLSWRPAPVSEPQMVQVEFIICSGAGGALARNSLDLMILPAAQRAATYTQPVAVLTRPDLSGAGAHAPLAPVSGPVSGPETGAAALQSAVAEPEVEESGAAARLRLAMRRLGYDPRRGLGPETRLAVTTYPTAELLAWVREGGDLLFLSRGPSPFFWVQGRAGAYGGGWITSFSWLRPEVFPRLRVINPLTMPFARVMPTGAIVGVPLEDPAVQPDVLAGMVAGWVRHATAHTVQLRYGRGRVVMTTFALEDTVDDDPVAQAMLHDLIDHLASDACRPTLQANY